VDNRHVDEGGPMRLRSGFLILILSASFQLAADYRFDVVLLKDSDLSCGIRISNDKVKVVDIQPLLKDKIEAIRNVHEHVPDHGLESPIPVLIEMVHMEGKRRRSTWLMNAIRESAARGCDLLIVLDVETYEKAMMRPDVMDLKLPVSYVLVLFGSQVKNSARSRVD
jgi:hypothetical protein